MYKFDPGSPAIEETFRNVALSQIDEALQALASTDVEQRGLLHEVRRRCKKLRGLLRLVRSGFPGFEMENAALRDAAALLSDLRDQEVLRETMAGLSDGSGNDGFQRVVQRLMSAPLAEPAQEKLSEVRLRLLAVRERATEWTLRKDAPAVLLRGLRKTYKQDRTRMARALASGEARDFHGWRKAHKAHGFHVDLLRNAAPDVLDADLQAIDRLSDLLGVHHDLAVLLHAVDIEAHCFGSSEDVAALRGAIHTRRKDIEERAGALGRQLLAERPRALAERFARYWKRAA
jgi:hypothetical protein